MDTQTLAIIVLLGSFAVMILLRFPIAYAVGLSSVFCLMVMGNSLADVCRLMVAGISSYSLMAVPFFITMGVLMGSGGISDKLIALANACVGWMRGGLAMVNIVASYFFGGISGSAADTASIGSIMIPMMVDQGYDDDFSTAVTITSSCEGLLVPPSHNMVIYSMTAGSISVGSLFLAGYLPGAILAIALMIGSYIISVKRNYPKGEKFHLVNFFKQLLTSFWALAAIVIVIYGVVSGKFTATESAAIAVIYSLIVSVFVYKGLNWKGVWKALDECVGTLAIVLILIATSKVFGNCLTLLHVPDLAAQAIVGLTDNGVWPEPDEVLYREEYAQPVLVFVGYEEFRDEPDIEIIASDSGGAGGLVTWYPVWDVEVGGDMIVPTGEDYAPLVMDFTLFGDVTGLDYWGDPDSWEPTGDDWWVPPTEEGLADTCWVCDGWSLNLLGGGGDPNCAGIAELYCQFEDGQEYQLLYSGVWRMVDDCLQLIVSTGAGNLPSDASGVFPVLIDPSGDYLHIQQDRDNGMRPPFFDNDMSSMELIRSYG